MMHQLLTDTQRTPRPGTLERLPNGLGIDIARLYERVGIATSHQSDAGESDPQRRLLEALIAGCDLGSAQYAVLEKLERDRDRFAALQAAVRHHILAAIQLADRASA